MNAAPAGDATDLTADSPTTTAKRPGRRASWTGLLAALWPVQRTILLGCLGAVATVIAALCWYRLWSNGLLADIRTSPPCLGSQGEDSPECGAAISEALYYKVRTPMTLLQLACAAVTVGGGVVLGVAAVARDFEQRTQVLLLTQSVSRARWFVAKVAVVGVPWVLAMVPLGAAATLSLRDDAAYLGDAMDPARFYFSPWSLPLIGLVGIAAGVAISTVLRTTLGALLLAAVLTALIVVGAELARPHLVPTTRIVSPPDVYAIGDAPAGSWFRGTGYLDAEGKERGNDVMYTQPCGSLDDPHPTTQKLDEWWGDCLRQAGIVAGYTDVIEPRWFAPLRLLWSGLLVAVSASLLLGGFLQIRRRVL